MVALEETLTRQAAEAVTLFGLPAQVPQLVKYRENAVFQVRLAGGARAALRLHRPGYHTPEALESELVWMMDLRTQGLSVPAPIPAAGGALVVQLAEGRHVDLIRWVEGEPLGVTGVPLDRPEAELRSMFRALGDSMARMHEAADRFHPPAGFARPVWSAQGLLGDNPVWGRFWDCIDLDAAARGFLSDLREGLDRHLDAIGGSLDQGLIHADLVRENVLVSPDGVAFIDFDDCGMGYRLFDIATALLRNRREPAYAEIEAALLDGYLARRPTIAAEIGHLPVFLLLRSLTYIGWAGARPDLQDRRERLARYVAEARELASAWRQS
jgi:Ser/Thr protein kinase RdoA (MazF antagonist)